jgi:cysteine-rich repeat protein
MCKVHTDFNASEAIVGTFGNGTCAMYLHGWDPGGTGNNGWDTVDCAQAIPAALQAYGAVCCGDSSKMLCAPDAGIYPNCDRSLGNYPKCDRQLSFEEMLAGLSKAARLRMPDWMAGCPCHQDLWGGYAGNKQTELVQTLQCLYDEAKRGCKVCDAGHTGPGGGACTACAAGKFKPVPGSAACTSCGAGKYAEGTASTVCSDCGSGTYSAAVGATVNSTCSGTRCSAGKYGQTGATSASATTCLLCPAGTYMALTGASACTNCTAGKYSAAVGATTVDTCSGCDAGKFSATVGATTVDTCSDCDAGKFSATVGATTVDTCFDCDNGTFSADVGATAVSTCVSCVAGTYSAAAASTACTSCEAGKYGQVVRSTACTSCVAGKFSAAAGASVASTCADCGAGKYSAAVASTCADCGAGKYSATAGSSACNDCAAGASSDAGSTSASNCTCTAGSRTCGDGTKEPSERCDDGNTVNGDGCSGTCTIEAGHSCTMPPCALSTCRVSLRQWSKLDAAAGVTGTGPGAYHAYRMSQVGADLLHFGGRDRLGPLSADFFNYSTSSKAWTKLDAAAGVTGTGPSARWFHAMTTVDQDIFVFGGATNSDGGEFCIPLAVLCLRKVGSAFLAGDHPSKWEQVAVALAGRSVILYTSKGK